MFNYYGSKSKLAKLYPKPKHEVIVEPFAGSARYAMLHWKKEVFLYDLDPTVITIWKYLQQCSKQDILALPKLKKGDVIKASDFECEAQYLLMRQLIQGGAKLGNIVTLFGISNMRNSIKNISNDVGKIKHWHIELLGYEEVPNHKATWFIDPPYQYGGEHYRKSSKSIDFKKLAKWCMSRNGQIIVCENTKADWMEFIPLKQIKGITHNIIILLLKLFGQIKLLQFMLLLTLNDNERN